MCCTDSACQWYDVRCNFAALATSFSNTAVVTDAIKQKFALLSADVQQKLLDVQQFASVPVKEFMAMPDDLFASMLSSLKSTASMTREQLQGIAVKLPNLPLADLNSFFSNLSPAALRDSLTALSAQTWDATRGSALLDRVRSSDVFGAASQWRAEQLDSLGGLTSQLSAKDVGALSETALAQAAAVARLTVAQLQPALARAATFTASNAGAMYDKLSSDTFKTLIPTLSKQAAEFSPDGVIAVMAKVRASLGAAEQWSAEHVTSLGSLAQHVTADDIGRIASSTALSALFTAPMGVSENPKAWSDQQTVALLAKAKSVYGGVASWTATQVTGARSLLKTLPLEDLRAFSDDVWRAPAMLEFVGSVKDFSAATQATIAARLSSAAVLGPVSAWSADAVASASKVLPVFTATDLRALPPAALAAGSAALTALGAAAASFSTEQAAAVVARAKEVLGSDGGSAPATAFTGAYLNALGPFLTAALSSTDIALIPADNVAAAVSTWGKGVAGFTATQAAAVLAKLKSSRALGADVGAWSAATVASLSSALVSALPAADLSRLASLDTLKAVTSALQATAVSASATATATAAAAANANALTADKAAALASRLRAVLGGTATWSPAAIKDWAATSGAVLAAALPAVDITALSSDAFRGAAESLRDVKGWGAAQAVALADKAVKTFGAAATWNQTTVTKLGALIAGLDVVHLPLLDFKLVMALDDVTFANIDWTVNPGATLAALPNMTTEAGKYSSVQGAALVTALRDSKLLGTLTQWSAKSMDAVGGLAQFIPVADLYKLPTAAWAASAALASFTAPQLRALAAPLRSLPLPDFAAAVSRAGGDAFRQALPELAAAGAYTNAQTASMLERAKSADVFGSVRSWGVDAVRSLGGLCAGLSVSDISALSADALRGGLADLAAVRGFTSQQGEALLAATKTVLGATSTWSADTLQAAASLISLLPAAEIAALPTAAVNGALSALGKADGAAAWSAGAAAAMLERMKAAQPASQWTAAALTQLSSALLPALSVADDLRGMADAEFLTALSPLGAVPSWTPVQSAALVARLKAVPAFANAAAWTDAAAKRVLGGMKDLSAALPLADLKALSVTAVGGALAEVAAVRTWSSDAADVLLTKVKASGVLGSIRTWGATEVSKLGSLAARLSASDWAGMTGAAVRAALPALATARAAMLTGAASAGARNWTTAELAAVMSRLKASDAFGAVASWNGQTLTALSESGFLGEALAGLGEIPRLPAAAFAFALSAVRDSRKWSAAEATLLADKAIAAFGAVSSWNQDTVTKLGAGIAWLRSGDLPSLNFKYVLAMDDATLINIDWTLNPNALIAAMPAAGAIAGWSSAKAGALVSAYRRAVASDFSLWTQANLDRLGGLVTSVNVTDIVMLGVAAWKDGTALAKFTGRQLGTLAAKLGQLTTTEFTRFVSVVNPQALREALVEVAAASASSVSRAQLLLARLTSPEVFGGIEGFASDTLRALGDVAAALSPAALSTLSVAAVRGAAADLAAVRGWSEAQRAALLARVKEVYGAVAVWDAAPLKELRGALALLPLADLEGLHPATVRAASAALSAVKTFTLQQRAALAALAAAAATTLAPVADWVASDIVALRGFLDALPVGQIARLSNVAVRDGLETLSSVRTWTTAQSSALLLRVDAAFGTADTWTADTIRSLGALTAQLPVEKLSALGADAFRVALKDLTALEGWSAEQKNALVAKTLAVYGGAATVTALAVRQLRDLAALLPVEAIESMSGTVFLEVAADLGKLVAWTQPRLDAVAAKVAALVSQRVLPAISAWSAVTLDSLQGFFAALPLDTFRQLSADALAGAASVAAFGARELGAVVSKLPSMLPAPLRRFLESINVDALVASDAVMAALSGAVGWSAEQRGIVWAAIKRSSAFAAAGQWSDAMMARVTVFAAGSMTAADFRRVASAATQVLAAAGGMAAKDISAAASTLLALSSTQLDAFLGSADVAALRQALSALGSRGAVWSDAQRKVLLAAATRLAGSVSAYTADTLISLGDLLVPALRGAAASAVAAIQTLPPALLTSGPALAALRAAAGWSRDELSALATASLAAVAGAGAAAEAALLAEMGQLVTFLSPARLSSLRSEGFRAALAVLTAAGARFTVEARAVLVPTALSALGAAATWTEVEVRLLGDLLLPALRASSNGLDSLSTAAFTAALPALAAAEGWSAAELSVLSAKAKLAYGDVKTWTTVQVAALGPILGGLGSDLSLLPGPILAAAVSDLSRAAAAAAATAATAGGWTVAAAATLSTQLKSAAVWGEVRTWSADNIQALGGLAASVLSAADLSSLSPEAFAGGLASLRDATAAWTAPQRAAIAAKGEQLYGDASEWSAEAVSNLGALMAGLPAVHIPKLTVSASVRIVPAAAAAMTPAQTAALSAAQVSAMPAESSARFTGAALAAMKPAARAAAVCGRTDTTPPTTKPPMPMPTTPTPTPTAEACAAVVSDFSLSLAADAWPTDPALVAAATRELAATLGRPIQVLAVVPAADAAKAAAASSSADSAPAPSVRLLLLRQLAGVGVAGSAAGGDVVTTSSSEPTPSKAEAPVTVAAVVVISLRASATSMADAAAFGAAASRLAAEGSLGSGVIGMAAAPLAVSVAAPEPDVVPVVTPPTAGGAAAAPADKGMGLSTMGAIGGGVAAALLVAVVVAMAVLRARRPQPAAALAAAAAGGGVSQSSIELSVNPMQGSRRVWENLEGGDAAADAVVCGVKA